MSIASPVERTVSKIGFLAAFLVTAALLVPAGFVQASGPDGTVRGVVTDSVSTNPVAGAEVVLSASDLPWDFRTTTDAVGSFALAVPNHRYTLEVWGAGYRVNTTGVTVGSGQIVWFNLTLSPANARSSRLQGYVTDSGSGAPVTQGRIVSDLQSGTAYRNASALSGSGYYEMALVPGMYQVSTDGVLGYVPYSTTVFMISGPAQWLNLSLAADPLVAWINGTVIDATNYSALAGATIAANVGGLQLPSVTSNATGSFSMQVPAGNVQLAADALGHAPLLSSVYVWGAGTYAPYFYLTPLSADLRGTVRDGLTGAPISGASVVANPFWSTGYFDQVVTNRTGAYDLHLTADDFYLGASAPGYTSWASYAFLYSGGTYWANVTLWPIVSVVKGYILDGANGSPVPGLAVYVTDARSGYSISAVADASGLFSFDLPPSPAITLRVLGTTLYAGAVGYVATRPFATTWANLTLDPLSVPVSATVTDAITGLPIASATVYVSWYYGTNWGFTDAGGAVTMLAASGLSLTVQAWATGYFAWYGTFPASTSLTVPISLNPSLPTNVTVQGYVRDAGTNASIVSAYVRVDGYDGSAPYDFTDGTGYYQMSLVARPQTVHATDYGYAEGRATLSPSMGGTIWLNLSLPQDALAPRILDFTAIPSTNLQPSNPANLLAHVNETSFARATVSILMERSVVGNVGTFLNLEALNPGSVSVALSTPGNVSVASAWDTRTPVGRLSDGTASEWWPAIPFYSPFQVAVPGYWDNATLSTPAYGIAVFDSRTGNLLYVNTLYGYVGPQEQPASTFTPYASGLRVDLTTAAVLGSILVAGSSYRTGSLRMSVASSVPAGTYAALIEAWDAGSNYANAAVLLRTALDTVPPVANAGPDRTVDEGSSMVFNGSASSDNVGVDNYTWMFTDGGTRDLYGAFATYIFTNPGSYLVTLTVRDAAGNAASDTLLVTVRDTIAPVVSLDAPSEAANLSGGVGLVATASDNVAVVRVEFRVDGASVGNVSVAPFMLALDTRTLSNGNHTVEAVAFDAAANSASSVRHVVVFNVPGTNAGSPAGLDIFLWGGLLALIAAAAAFVLVLSRRRRPRPPVAVPPPTPATNNVQNPSTETDGQEADDLL